VKTEKQRGGGGLKGVSAREKKEAKERFSYSIRRKGERTRGGESKGERKRKGGKETSPKIDGRNERGDLAHTKKKRGKRGGPIPTSFNDAEYRRKGGEKPQVGKKKNDYLFLAKEKGERPKSRAGGGGERGGNRLILSSFLKKKGGEEKSGCCSPGEGKKKGEGGEKGNESSLPTERVKKRKGKKGKEKRFLAYSYRITREK